MEQLKAQQCTYLPKAGAMTQDGEKQGQVNKVVEA